MSSQPTATVTVTPPTPVTSSSAPTTPAVAQTISGSKILDVIQPFVIGGLSGMFATCIIQPVDMIKVSIQLKSEEQINHKARISPFTVAGEIMKA
jgi:solute carrier family 25 oxoglutarate transporter 11